ncbi:hypothetical protein GCM10027596_26770 [Nocardioides korecus]
MTICTCTGRGPRGIEHLVWPARRLRNRIRSAWLWRRQGRPLDEPIVVRRGQITSCRHGHYLVTDWCWDFRHQTSPIAADILVDRYTGRYPVQRVRDLHCCPACRSE